MYPKHLALTTDSLYIYIIFLNNLGCHLKLEIIFFLELHSISELTYLKIKDFQK